MSANAIEELVNLGEQSRAERGILHTPGEILQQPEAWRQATERVFDLSADLRAVLSGAHELILTGAGSSYFAGVCAEAALTRALGLPVRAVASTEIVMDPESTLPGRPFALVSLARSGNSPEGNAAFELAEELRGDLVRHVVITANPEGVLAGLAGTTRRPAALCLLPPQTNDRGLAMTSSLTSLVVAAQALGFLDRPGEYRKVAEALSQAAEEVLRDAGRIAAWAREPFRRAFFVGARPFFGAALESHLKVQELTDGIVVGKAEDTLGLRHGPMAAVDAETLVVVFCSRDEHRRKYEGDLLRELAGKNLGLKRIAVAPRVEESWRAFLHDWVEFDPGALRGIPDDLVSPVLIIPAQALGLFKSLELGLKPDAPSRNRAISRVVQGVTIYRRGRN